MMMMMMMMMIIQKKMQVYFFLQLQSVHVKFRLVKIEFNKIARVSTN